MQQRRQGRGDARHLRVDLTPAEAHDAPPEGGEALVARAVVLEGLRREVSGAAVDLDDELALAPDEIGLRAPALG